MGIDGRRDEPDNIFDATVRGLAKLRDLVTQIADPTAPPRPQPVSGPGRRPPRELPRPVPANGEGAREPVTDVYDEGEFVRIVADMPGADPATLQVRGSGNRLAIAASGPARRYERTLLLPAAVRLEQATPTFVNGIMELLLPAVREAPPLESTPATPAGAQTREDAARDTGPGA